MADAPELTKLLAAYTGAVSSVADPDYEAYVEDCRIRHLPAIIENTSSVHARVVIKNLFALAKDTHENVYLVTGILNDETYSPMQPEISAIMESGSSFNVITLCSEDQLLENRVYKIIKDHKNGNVWSLNEPITSATHFLLIGNTGYRFEVDDMTKTAYACFNDRHGLITSVLAREFNEMLARHASGEDKNARRGSIRPN